MLECHADDEKSRNERSLFVDLRRSEMRDAKLTIAGIKCKCVDDNSGEEWREATCTCSNFFLSSRRINRHARNRRIAGRERADIVTVVDPFDYRSREPADYHLAVNVVEKCRPTARDGASRESSRCFPRDRRNG